MRYTAASEENTNYSVVTSKSKGVYNQMAQRKKRPKMAFKKFLKGNKNILKKLEKKTAKAKPYTREPWMMRFNPTEDKYEKFLQKEAESL